MKNVEVCLSPKLFENYSLENKIIVIVDILRATSIITTMFHNGLSKLIPVKSLEEALEYKQKGFLVAAERKGKKIDFADFDNSPYSFSREKIENKTLVYSTTNGTNTIHKAKKAEQVILATFLNLTAVSNYLKTQNKDILILCSGWQGDYCTEDSIFAGALYEKLKEYNFVAINDSLLSSYELWKLAKNDLLNFIKDIHQYKRLVQLGLKDIIEYCFQLNISNVIPIVKNDYVVDLKKLT